MIIDEKVIELMDEVHTLSHYWHKLIKASENLDVNTMNFELKTHSHDPQSSRTFTGLQGVAKGAPNERINRKLHSTLAEALRQTAELAYAMAKERMEELQEVTAPGDLSIEECHSVPKLALSPSKKDLPDDVVGHTADQALGLLEGSRIKRVLLVGTREQGEQVFEEMKKKAAYKIARTYWTSGILVLQKSTEEP